MTTRCAQPACPPGSSGRRPAPPAGRRFATALVVAGAALAASPPAGADQAFYD